MEMGGKNKELNILYERLSGVEDKLLAKNAKMKTDITKLQLENANIKRVHEETSRQVSELMSTVSQLTDTVSQLTGKRKPKQNPKHILRWVGGTRTKPVTSRYK